LNPILRDLAQQVRFPITQIGPHCIASKGENRNEKFQSETLFRVRVPWIPCLSSIFTVFTLLLSYDALIELRFVESTIESSQLFHNPFPTRRLAACNSSIQDRPSNPKLHQRLLQFYPISDVDESNHFRGSQS